MQREIHTPEGMRDIYGIECRKKKLMQERLMQVIRSYGFEDIETPVIEYFDVFSKEVGTTASRDLYKFFDRIGDTLVLRPDFTPSIARAVSMYFGDEKLPKRLCYQGKTFENRHSYQGRLNESTQIGVEYLGDDSVEADSELLALAVETMRAAGLKEFQISIGEVNFFKALVDEAGMDEETELALRKYISNKNMFGAEEILDQMNLSAELKTAFREFSSLFGGPEILEKARSLTNNQRALAAVRRLEQIYDVLKLYGVEEYVSFDLSMLSKYRYYTGIIFQGYTYGSGEPLVKGGRYDKLLEHFGADMPAIGFGLVIEYLMNALERQKIEITVEDQKLMLIYDKGCYARALSLAKEKRKSGCFVSLVAKDPDISVSEYETMAAKHQCAFSYVEE